MTPFWRAQLPRSVGACRHKREGLVALVAVPRIGWLHLHIPGAALQGVQDFQVQPDVLHQRRIMCGARTSRANKRDKAIKKGRRLLVVTLQGWAAADSPRNKKHGCSQKVQSIAELQSLPNCEPHLPRLENLGKRPPNPPNLNKFTIPCEAFTEFLF